MRVERISDPGEEWDEFVAGSPGHSLGHAAAWARVLRRAYSLEPVFLAARDAAGALAGVLPLAHFRTGSGRRELVSLPYLDAAGILARSPEAERVLLDAALELARERGARALELRQLQPLATVASRDKPDRVDLALALERDEEAQWKALPGTVRNQTRKAWKAGLEVAESVRDPAAEFYAPFSVNMRDLGSPVHALGFFRAAAEAFGPRLRFIVARDGSRPVGGLVAIRYADTVTVPWASTLRSERARCPNNLIYWEALRWAVAEGARELDFGRSPRDSGSHRFKRGWGARERPLEWTRLAPTGRRLPASAPDRHALLRGLSALWTRLPVALTVAAGPRIRRYLSV